jgi:deoxyribodipyrimidine photo-lyase
MPATGGPVSSPPGAPDITRWWEPGEPAAQARLAKFVDADIERYDDLRDRPALHATSELSPRLAWGEISAAQVANSVLSAGGDIAEPFLRQLAWREFSYHVLYRNPEMATVPLRDEFASFPWSASSKDAEAWQCGMTGYPLVDAGMRQLAATGWMHNRVRLVAASFLTKDLLGSWQSGEEFFGRRLADYDPAANAFNWQWVAGCGADAAPYFRIFNPTVQGARFDPDGDYVRAWVPELKRLESRWIHRPWDAPGTTLADAGIVLGRTYPNRIVEHAEARHRALAAYDAIRVSR